MGIVRMALVPRDGLFLKDGRGWFSNAAGRGHGLSWPFPPTVLGALRTALGRSREATEGIAFDADRWRRETVDVHLDKMLALRRPFGADWGRAHRMWRPPADALYLEGEAQVFPLRPVRAEIPTLGRNDDLARESLWRPVVDEQAKPQAPPRWWPEKDFVAWLCGVAVSKHVGRAKAALELQPRVEAHVGIDPDTFAARTGILFSTDILETLTRESNEWAVAFSAELPGCASQLPVSVVTLGGDRRLARAEPLSADVFAPPADLLAAFAQGARGIRLTVVTPALFAHGWLPDGFQAAGDEYRGALPGTPDEIILRAAFVPRPEHVSGWDMAARRPKPTLRLVPSGAVYFFEKMSGAAFIASEARSLWLAAIGSRVEEGLGRVVPGVWMPGSRSQGSSS